MIRIIFSLIGGLGIFLFGMKNVSNGMQKIAGNRIKKVLNNITSKLYKSIIFGVFTTVIIQSSSVVSSLVVALVNSQLLTSRQSLGIILGTNIGTTITGWIFTMKIDKIGIPIIAVASLGYIYSNIEKNKIKFLTMLGLGFIFLGLLTMGEALKPLRYNSNFIKLFQIGTGENIFSIIKVVGIGTVLTGIIQSSSAVLGIIITLASQELIGFEVAVALVIGANIGTTITPIISSIGTSKEAKRTAIYCTMIKLFQGVWCLVFFSIYLKFLIRITENMDISQSIAFVHTVSNIFNTFLFILIYKAYFFIFKDIKEKKELKKKNIEINSFLKITSESMAEELKKESLKISLLIREIIFKLEKDLESFEINKKNIIIIENFHIEIINFHKELMKTTFNFFKTSEKKGEVKKIMEILKSVKEYREIGKYLYSISKKILILKKIKNSQYEITKIKIFHRIFLNVYEVLIENLKVKDKENIYKVFNSLKILDNENKEIKKYYEKLLDKEENINEKNIYFLDILNSYKRIIFHLKEIVEIKKNKDL